MILTIAQQDGRNRERGVDPMVLRQSYDTVRLLPGDAQNEQIGQYQAPSTDSRHWPCAQGGMRAVMLSAGLTPTTSMSQLSRSARRLEHLAVLTEYQVVMGSLLV